MASECVREGTFAVCHFLLYSWTGPTALGLLSITQTSSSRVRRFCTCATIKPQSKTSKIRSNDVKNDVNWCQMMSNGQISTGTPPFHQRRLCPSRRSWDFTQRHRELDQLRRCWIRNLRACTLEISWAQSCTQWLSFLGSIFKTGSCGENRWDFCASCAIHLSNMHL